MYRQRRIFFVVFLFSVSLIFAGCAPTLYENNKVITTVTAVDSVEVSDPSLKDSGSLTPQQVTENFYSWYLEAIGDRSDGDFVNPLATGLYRDSEYLTDDFVAKVDEIVAGSAPCSYDPFLQAQDIPVSFEVQEPAIKGTVATVILLRTWGGNPDPSPMVVHLVQENGRWLIDNVTPFEIPVMDPPVEPETPDTVVRAFYDWYLGYIGQPGSDNFRNPMVDKAYHDTPYLTDSFVGHIDELLASFSEMGSGYDPFLCAQAIPTEMTPDTTFARNGVASVVVRSSFPNHMVTIDLRPEGESWLISNITCANDPAGTATAFYTWYLGYTGERGSNEFRNPLVDEAYHDQPLLAENLVQSVDKMLANSEAGGFDPFLLAQEIPQDFSVDPGVAEETAVVHLQFGSECVKHLLVTMDETGQRIVTISEDEGLLSEAPVDEGSSVSQASYTSSEYGFSFSYPTTWVLDGMDLAAPGRPDDWPVTTGWLLMPPNVDAYLASHSGPPNPNAPVIVAPFNIEVVIGDQEAVVRVYGTLAGETAVFNDHEALLLKRDPGYTHVIFAHPLRPDTWIVLTDWVTGFPDRENQAVVAEPMWQPVLNSLQFNK